jgi:hypothetical protein|tara:strand:+ start:340 stop:645 length:306 start_codon:yes stop_codon:yes gene_type:complete
MAEISTGTRTDVSSRDVPVRKDDAIFSTVKTMTGNTDGSVGVLYLTGSLAGSSGFIIQSAGNSVITPTHGDSIAASALTAKQQYDIGLFSISGSGTVSVLY